jgi:hypothetical protein
MELHFPPCELKGSKEQSALAQAEVKRKHPSFKKRKKERKHAQESDL